MLSGLKEYLQRNGVSYMFPWMNVYYFLAIRIGAGLLLSVTACLAGYYIPAVPAFFAGYMLPKILFNMSNNSDNDHMVSDIECIYDIMRIQARAGVYIQDSLMDCYMTAKNARLKSALLELCNGIGAKSTLKEELEKFRMKFNNRHIDVLCIILGQAQTTGKSVQILSDMTEQIRQVRHTVALKEKGKLERRIEILELLIFVGILGIGIYTMGSEILKMMQF